MRKRNTLNKVTLKPYLGKKLDLISISSKVAAEAYLEVVNKQFS